MNNKLILWRKVFGIAAIQGVVTLTWVIYNAYFPKLLVGLGLTVGIAKVVLIIEHFLEAIIEPIFGEISDNLQNKIGTKIPIISRGIILASLFFMAIPLLGILIKPQGQLAYLLAMVAILWASCMAIFRSPAISLMFAAAPMDKLPQAFGVLNLIGGIVGAFRFDAYGIILKLGPNFAFFIGSISLLIVGFYLRYLYPPNPSANLGEIGENLILPKIKLSLLGLIISVGISISFSLRFILPTLNNIFTSQIGENQAKLGMMLFLILMAFLSLPMGFLAAKFGNYNAILVCLLITIISLQFLTFIPSWLVIIILCGSLSLVLNSVIPLIMELMPPTRMGLAIGCYFGGFGAGLSFFDLIFTKVPLNEGMSGSAIALLCAMITMRLSRKVSLS
jgi:Na+/melibiose symporter-like transporter